MAKYLKIEAEDSIGLVTLNRPEALNAWHSAMRTELSEALKNFEGDDEIRAVIITGAGDRAFSAGQDLHETQSFDKSRATDWIEEWRALYGTMRSMTKPIVAALNGVAAGSAFQVALLCDIRVGHSGSNMGQPEINSGIASTLGPWIMREMLGLSRTIELTLTGRMMSGNEAHHIGLIHYLVEHEGVMDKARELATLLASKPPIAMRLDKQRFAEVTESGFEEALAAGTRNQAAAYESGEPQRMMAEFFAERARRKSGASA